MSNLLCIRDLLKDDVKNVLSLDWILHFIQRNVDLPQSIRSDRHFFNETYEIMSFLYVHEIKAKRLLYSAPFDLFADPPPRGWNLPPSDCPRSVIGQAVVRSSVSSSLFRFRVSPTTAVPCVVHTPCDCVCSNRGNLAHSRRKYRVANALRSPDLARRTSFAETCCKVASKPPHRLLRQYELRLSQPQASAR